MPAFTAASSFGESFWSLACSASSAESHAEASGVVNCGTNDTMTTPPFLGSSLRIASGTLRGWPQSARVDEWEKMTGARVTRRTSSMVSSETWLRSASMPRRFISRITSSPNAVRPPCSGVSVAESAHGVFFECVSVM